MEEIIENYQSNFSGFINTPFLFTSKVLGMSPYIVNPETVFKLKTTINTNERLGKIVEQFVIEVLKKEENNHILAQNLQIQHTPQQTIGEIDCLYSHANQVFHLEIQYKFYLFDPTVGYNEIEHCIGPNRKDTLIKKIEKLKEKQLPLLYSKYTKHYLETLNLESKNIEQQIYFKAQIFMPFGETTTLKTLNNDCIYGFYFNFKDLLKFNNCKFYIPKKLDWLVDVNTHVNWQNYEQILSKLKSFYTEKYAPMLWLKFLNGDIKKSFMVWW